MRCINCGGEIPAELVVCPYCGYATEDLQTMRVRQNAELKNRYYQIDKEYGLDVDYVSMPTEELLRFMESIEQKLQKDEADGALTRQLLSKVLSHVSNVDEELQSRFPLRKMPVLQKTGAQNEDIVISLLNDYRPPEVYAAAFKIRSGSERMLRDKYHFEYITKKDDVHKRLGFTLRYRPMFEMVTKSEKVAKQLTDDRRILNWFVHESAHNDSEIKKRLPTREAQANYLKQVYSRYKKYHLL